jgi:hypothetical protein
VCVVVCDEGEREEAVSIFFLEVQVCISIEREREREREEPMRIFVYELHKPCLESIVLSRGDISGDMICACVHEGSFTYALF